MSMNLRLTADIDAILPALNNQTYHISEYFRLWSTPTKVTYDILNRATDADKITAYIDWVRSGSEDEEIPVYADDDIWEERDPIRFDRVNPADEHIQDLTVFLENHTRWTLVWEAR